MNRAVVNHLEKQMQRTDVRMDELALQVGDIEKNIFSEENGEVEVDMLLKSVNEVRSNYQNLRKEITEVQELQRQLSSSLQLQIRIMQSKFNTLKEKIVTNVPGDASISSSVASSLNQLNHVHQLQQLHVNEHMGMGLDPLAMGPMSPMPNLLLDVPELPDRGFRHY